jgi:hypothetical protein
LRRVIVRTRTLEAGISLPQQGLPYYTGSDGCRFGMKLVSFSIFDLIDRSSVPHCWKFNLG